MNNVFSLTSPIQSNPELEQILRKQASSLAIPAKKVFLEAETASNGVYYIVSGRTRHYLLGADGVEKIFFVLTAGWFFGDTASLLSAPQPLYVMAEEPTDILFIPTDAFRGLMQNHPVVNEAVLFCQAFKNLMMLREIESHVFLSSRDRLLQLFYYSADSTFAFDGKWYSLKHNYTQQELGTILGVSRVTISKLVNEFCNDGIIRIVNRRMQINILHYNRLNTRFAFR